ncbi:class I SAM-dependent methyltransferase [Desulfosporosinus fructosivorans]|uniref:Class I SAM-dependent methyltransferase n=1 Tax=Desulfosporosinus fructosivorans TaxID=2018669 RepID=A0A4Z0R2G1_9FIRM|nr:class I SAM-dependent methyltransferase [Desulfosporosinus fructosivorans]TGE37272.1 class I SAM-dependent methyltransferase [Desulfosporosinus fructosivorans]
MGETKKVENMTYFELLAWLGIGSSHPGGFFTTKQTLDTIQIKSEDYVLDAGCGSGLTTCYLAKTTGSRIIGVDINPLMIDKAFQRAEKERVSHLVDFKVADVYSLPFAENFFDWVITESVTVFLDKVNVFREFYRVLKPKGQVADLEMTLLKELPTNLQKQLKEYYGSGTDPVSIEEWCNSLSRAGFEGVEIKNPQLLKTDNLVASELKRDWLLYKDLDDKIKKQPGLLPRLQRSADFIKKNQSYVGFGLLYGRKPVATPTKFVLKEWLRKKTFRK